MLELKVMYWYFVFGVVVSVIFSVLPHPRSVRIELGADIIRLIIKLLGAICLYSHIWG